MRQGVESLNPLLIISRFLFNHFKLLLIRKPCPSIVRFVAFFFKLRLNSSFRFNFKHGFKKKKNRPKKAF